MIEVNLKRQNENFILWEPVPPTDTPFTPIGRRDAAHSLTVAWIQPTELVAPAGAMTRAVAAPSVAPHDAMLKMAQEFPPDPSWYEENFGDVRHPGR